MVELATDSPMILTQRQYRDASIIIGALSHLSASMGLGVRPFNVRD